MALSGSFTGSTSNNGIVPKIVWSGEQSQSGNYTDVTAALYYSRTDSYSTYGTWEGSITIGGTSKSGSKYVAISYNSNTQVVSATVRIYHEDDGTKSIKISAEGGISGTTLTSTTISKTVTLDTIPLPSTVSATDADIGSKSTIAIKRASSSFTHTLKYSFGSLSGTIATKTTSTSISWTVPTTFYAQIPDDKTGECTITCTTYNGSTTVGTKSCTFTATASKTTCAPSVSVTAVDTNEATIALTGSTKNIIKGFSDVEVTTTATAKNSASISSVSVTCGTAKKTGTSVTFSDAESATIKATATDSRGYSNNATASGMTLISYIVPTIVESISRESPTSDTVNISVQGKWFNGSFGATENSLKVEVRYKPKSQASYEDTDKYVAMTVTTSGNTYTASVSLPGLVYTQAYSIRIRVIDAIHQYEGALADPVYRNTEISRGIPVFDWGEADFNFNVPVTINGYPLFPEALPVGYVCITSENTPPASEGTWALLDKEFIPIHGVYDDNSYFSLDSASACTFAFSRAHHTIYTRFLFAATDALSDSGITIGTVDIEKLGVTDLTYSKYAVGYSDGGGGVFMCELESTGALKVVDIVSANATIPSGSNCWVEFTHVVRHGSMLDEACNRFYWKRTA